MFGRWWLVVRGGGGGGGGGVGGSNAEQAMSFIVLPDIANILTVQPGTNCRGIDACITDLVEPLPIYGFNTCTSDIVLHRCPVVQAVHE